VEERLAWNIWIKLTVVLEGSLILSSDSVIEILIRNCIISDFFTKRRVTLFPSFSQITIKDPDDKSD
jgi:hypothetical protein